MNKCKKYIVFGLFIVERQEKRKVGVTLNEYDVIFLIL